MSIRERILESALRLLAEGGVHELTQPRVSRAAGVRQSHLTYYFPTRADLLQAVARHSIDRLARQLVETPPASLASLADALAAGSADKRRARIMLGLVTAADRDPAIRRRLRRFVTELRGRIAEVLGASGLDVSPGAIAFLHAAIVGCAVLQLARDNAGARAEAKAVLRFAFDSLRKLP